MIICGSAYKVAFERFAKELHELARPTTTNGVPDREPHAAVEAMATLLDRIASLEIPFWTLDRYCYRLIKEANKELGELHYTPNEVAFDLEPKKDGEVQ